MPRQFVGSFSARNAWTLSRYASASGPYVGFTTPDRTARVPGRGSSVPDWQQPERVDTRRKRPRPADAATGIPAEGRGPDERRFASEGRELHPHAVLAAIGPGAHVGEAAALIELAAGGVEERLAERCRHRAGEHDEAEVEHGDGRRHRPADHHPGALDDRRRGPPQRAVGLLPRSPTSRRTRSGSRSRRRRTAARRVRRRRGRAGRRCRAVPGAAGRCRSPRPRRRPTAAAPSRRRPRARRPSSARRGRGPGPSGRGPSAARSARRPARAARRTATRAGATATPCPCRRRSVPRSDRRSIDGADVLRAGRDDTPHQPVQRRPHVARRGGDPVAHDDVTGSVDDAGGQPVGADVDRQVGRHLATVTPP